MYFWPTTRQMKHYCCGDQENAKNGLCVYHSSEKSETWMGVYKNQLPLSGMNLLLMLEANLYGKYHWNYLKKTASRHTYIYT